MTAKELAELISASLNGEDITEGAFVITAATESLIEDGKFLLWLGKSVDDDDPELFEVSVRDCNGK